MSGDWLERTAVTIGAGAAVAIQGVIDFFSPMGSGGYYPTGNNHPIPGCPSPKDCRERGCVETCSEATEVGRMAESDGHMLAEPLDEFGTIVLCPTDGLRCECDRTSQGCRAYHTVNTPESSSLAVMQPAEKSPPHVSVGATARGEGPGSDSDIPPSPEPGCSTSDLLRAAAVEIEYYLCRENPSTQRNGREFTAKLRDCADGFDRAGEKLHGVETGQDMGASAFSSVDHAASFFEQHKKAGR